MWFCQVTCYPTARARPASSRCVKYRISEPRHRRSAHPAPPGPAPPRARRCRTDVAVIGTARVRAGETTGPAAYVDSRYAAREPCSCGTKVAFFKVTTTTYANIRELVRPASGQPALPGRGAISLLRDRWLRHHEILLHAWRTRRGFCPVLAESKAIDTLYSPQTTKLLGTSSGGMWNS